ncbi:MAG: hypothetical protein ABSC94_22000 [Polyangiaceae bacterium]|jgi:hypothetical protein
MSPAERAILASTPFVAVAIVMLGLRLGAPEVLRAAAVVGAPPSLVGLLRPWQIVAFEDDGAARSPLRHEALAILATGGEGRVLWRGSTNAEGVAEALLPRNLGPATTTVEVRAGPLLLASGHLAEQPTTDATRTGHPWLRFARRSGPIVLDVAVVGERVAPGFAAQVCVRATDGRTHAPLTGVRIDVAADPSIASSRGDSTDSAGWAILETTPVGLAVELTLYARSAEGASGDWIGGLFVSPGAFAVETRSRWAPDEEPVVEVVAPAARPAVYLEVDDGHGREWAATADGGEASPRGALRTTFRLPRLAAGIHWAIAAADRTGASELGPGTMVRPFFVATSDEAALALHPDPLGCAPRTDAREADRSLLPCLALVAASPLPRWLALDGVATRRAEAAVKRTRGLAVALGGLLVAGLLEATLIAGSAVRARARLADALPEGPSPRSRPMARAFGLAVALLVALLGFALLAAFLVRAG